MGQGMDGTLWAMNSHVLFPSFPFGRPWFRAVASVTLALSLLTAAALQAAETAAPTTARPTPKRCGFYLHAAWKYEYPFSVRTWSRTDYDQMFHLLKCFGFDTVMLWPVVEAVPMPLSDTDAKAVRGFRPTIRRLCHYRRRPRRLSGGEARGFPARVSRGPAHDRSLGHAAVPTEVDSVDLVRLGHQGRLAGAE